MSGDRGLNFLPPSTRAARRFANVVAGWWIPIKIVFGGSPLAGSITVRVTATDTNGR
jgi:hypothetical protein